MGGAQPTAPAREALMDSMAPKILIVLGIVFGGGFMLYGLHTLLPVLVKLLGD